MSLSSFKESPWKNSHATYQKSALAMTPAPEYANSEVVLSSLYRLIGFQGHTDREIPSAGKELDRSLQKARDRSKKPTGATLDADTLLTLLHSILESPKLPNQSSKRFIQVTPVVPQVATFSGSARLSRNSWIAGGLVERMILLGSDGHTAAEANWRRLFEALTVGDADDVFARFLQHELEAWTTDQKWQAVALHEGHADECKAASRDDLTGSPSRHFVRDVASIIQAKDAMTRRQWTSLLDAVLRLGAVAHVAWLCDVQARAWACIRNSLGGGGPRDELEVRAEVFPTELGYFTYGDRALSQMRDLVSAFLAARLGINAVLWSIEAAGEKVSGGLSSSSQISTLCEQVRRLKGRLDELGVAQTVDQVVEQENHALLCTKGIGSNVLEFVRHALGQRQAANPLLRGYDQGFVLKKKGMNASSPWVVRLGPVATLAMVHCSLAEAAGPRSVRSLARHLAGYGIVVRHRDIASNDLGHQLRMLGLVLDSPDAESGMLLVPPFQSRRKAGQK